MSFARGFVSQLATINPFLRDYLENIFLTDRQFRITELSVFCGLLMYSQIPKTQRITRYMRVVSLVKDDVCNDQWEQRAKILCELAKVSVTNTNYDKFMLELLCKVDSNVPFDEDITDDGIKALVTAHLDRMAVILIGGNYINKDKKEEKWTTIMNLMSDTKVTEFFNVDKVKRIKCHTEPTQESNTRKYQEFIASGSKETKYWPSSCSSGTW